MADSPKEGEAAQALFCAIADLLGEKTTTKEFKISKYPTYMVFKKKYSKIINDTFARVDTPQISLKQIEDFLVNKKGWFESTLNVAVKLIEDIETINQKFSKIQKPKLQDIMYVRGAKKEKGRNANAMENIDYLFKVANKNEKNYFGDINKWSPADIYLASDNASKQIVEEVKEASGKLNKSYNFIDLNKITSGLLKSGDLLPLSLKKAENKANLVQVNFDRSKEEAYLATIKYFGISDWSKKYTRAKPVTRDIKMYFSQNKKEKIKIRHDAYSKNFGINKAIKCEIEVTSAGGRGGSLVGIDGIARIISTVDSTFAKELKSAFNKGITEYAKNIEKTNKEFNVKNVRLQDEAKKAYDDERATLSGLYVSNAIMPVIYKFFKNNKDRVNSKIIQAFVAYASSRTPKSGKFVIAK